MDLSKIGNFIRDLRVEKGLSQGKLADMVPVTRQAVSRWEQGKSLPDSQTLIILSEIFDVSIDEIIAGKRTSPEEKEKITLELVDEYNNKKRTIRKITIVSVLIIFSLLILFFGYYFFNSYNSIKVYRINGVGDHFISKDGIMITTKQKTYLRLGELRKKDNDKEIKSVKLFFINAKGDEKVLYEDSKTDILITSSYGYNKDFSERELKYIKNNLYLEITYDEKKETIRLQIEKDFSNNLWFYHKKDSMYDDENLELSVPSVYNKILLNIQEKGTKEGEDYKLEIETADEKIKFLSMNRELYIEVDKNEYSEKWSCFFSNEFSFVYGKYVDNFEEIHATVIINSERNLREREKELYKELTNYINKYLLN